MTKKRIFTISLIFTGIAIILFFGAGALRAFKHMEGHGPFNDGSFDGRPAAANQDDVSLIREWMTVPYIAKMYQVPPDAIFKSLEIHEKEDENKKLSLAQLNEKYYPDQEGIVLAHVQAVMQAFQKQEPPPSFPAKPIFTPTVTP
jgi:hypothetical protein